MSDIQQVIGTFVDTMITHANTDRMKRMRLIQALSDTMWLRDFRTITYNIPRQSGASFWVMADFLKHVDNSIIIVYDAGHRDVLRDGYTREGVYIPPSGLDIDRNDVGLPTHVMRRIFTTDEVKTFIKMGEATLFMKKIERVYLFCEGMLFSKVSKNKFYDWLAVNVLDENGFVIGTK